MTTPPPPGRRIPAFPAVATLLVLVLVWAWGCSGPSPLDPEEPPTGEGPCGTLPETFAPFENGLTAVGTDTTLEVATWNLEFFPLTLPGDYDCPHPVDRDRQFAVADLVNLVDLDVIAVQEISDPGGFAEFVELCRGYEAVLSPEDRGCNYQRVGLLYRADRVTVRSTTLLFTEDRWAFPRSPLRADLTVVSNGSAWDFSLIVVHLKASGDSESEQRRRAASRLLKRYLDQEAEADPSADFMVAGDWNDEVDEPLIRNSFPDFVQDPSDYQFVSLALAGSGEFASHPFRGGSLIDHILVNRAACPDMAGARVTTLRFDRVVPGYDDISDHRPVVLVAPVFR